MNNVKPPVLNAEKSAFDDDNDCELGSDIDGDEQDNPTSALQNNYGGQFKNFGVVNQGA